MRKAKIGAALFSVFLFVPSIGFGHEIQGLGTSSCAEYAKMYRRSPEDADLLYHMWAQGYMSGLNAAAGAERRAVRELGGSLADQKKALRKFCSDNPLKDYIDGVNELYIKLPFSPSK